jgi:maltose alpha-D-glucosyltransferase/alpha-amylase
MPRIFMALKKGRADDMVDILNRTPPIPENCQWCTFLRNHDELTLEMVTPEEREWMWREYAPDPRMKLNLGIRRRLAPLLDNDRQKIQLAHSLLFTLPGSPIVYYGDEIGMGDNIWLDDRNGVRTPMQWDSGPAAGFSDAPIHALYAPVMDDEVYGPSRVNVESQQKDGSSLWNVIRHMIGIRKQHHAFGWGEFHWLDCDNNSVAAFNRTFKTGNITAIHNLSGVEQGVNGIRLEKPATDLLTNKIHIPENGNMDLRLKPYEYLWLKI